MAIGNLNVGTAKQITGSANIKSSQGALLQVIVSSASTGTLALYDDAATGTTVKLLDTMTITAGQSISIPIAFSNGLYAVIGGTASLTIVYV